MYPETRWIAPLHHPVLQPDEVHIWRVDLPLMSGSMQMFKSLLLPDELARADQFVFQDSRQDFVISRGILRILLGSYLDLAPHQIWFRYNQYGKPYLASNGGTSAVHFNLSHSRHLTLNAFTLNAQIGIDVEYVNTGIDYEALAAMILSPSEKAAFGQVAPALRCAAFYNAWTRKEAYIKAQGAGFSYPLDQFEVSFQPGQPPVLLATRPDDRERARWFMDSVAASPDYAAAIVVEGHTRMVRHFNYCL